MKRDVITCSREEGGLGLIYPYDFILSLKLTLLNKLLGENFDHSWKYVAIQQLSYPDQVIILVENCLAQEKCFLLKIC